jgi:hypothetical protein
MHLFDPLGSFENGRGISLGPGLPILAGYLQLLLVPIYSPGQEKQVKLSVLLKDTEKQNATWLRFELGTSCYKVWHSATATVFSLHATTTSTSHNVKFLFVPSATRR